MTAAALDRARAVLDQPAPPVLPGQTAIGDQPEPTTTELAAAHMRGWLFDLETL